MCVVLSTRVYSDSKTESFVGVFSMLNVGCSVVLGLTVCCVPTKGYCKIAIFWFASMSIRSGLIMLIILSIIIISVVWNYIVLN